MTKIEKYLFTGFGLCFALKNSSSKLHYIKGMHIGHLLTLFCILTDVISSPEPKAHGELIVYQSSRRLSVYLCVCLSVCLSVCVFTFSNTNISETSGPIATKFYLKHHWAGGKDALGFGPDLIGTLVSMATDSSHRVIMGKML